jgi:hypothetical protein
MHDLEYAQNPGVYNYVEVATIQLGIFIAPAHL